jgi:uncharacterized repeat protein (TIGR01451 family)
VAGGFGGGGAADGFIGGGSGGGASDVRSGGFTLGERLLVAGGGGGAGSGSIVGAAAGGSGGAGGGASGGAGAIGGGPEGAGGGGGTATSGGSGGGFNGQPGAAGVGGLGDAEDTGAGGGGGGGWFGGGGGSGTFQANDGAGGGGGGSGFGPGGVVLASGVQVGNGELTITYTPAVADLSIALAAQGVPGILSGHIEYAITVTNNGPAALVSGTVTATLPTPMTATSSDCAVTGGRVVCTLGALASGASLTDRFDVPIGLLTVNHDYVVTATRTASSPADPNPANDSASRTCSILTSLIVHCS